MVYLSIDVESATEYQLEYLLVDGLNLACRVLQLNKLVNQRLFNLFKVRFLISRINLFCQKQSASTCKQSERAADYVCAKDDFKITLCQAEENVHLVHSHNMLHVLAITHTTYDHVKHVMI